MLYEIPKLYKPWRQTAGPAVVDLPCVTRNKTTLFSFVERLKGGGGQRERGKSRSGRRELLAAFLHLCAASTFLLIYSSVTIALPQHLASARPSFLRVPVPYRFDVVLERSL